MHCSLAAKRDDQICRLRRTQATPPVIYHFLANACREEKAAPLYALRILQSQHNTEIKERIVTAPPEMAESLGAPQLCTALAAPILWGSFLSSIAWRLVARLRLAPILARCRLDASISAGLPACSGAGRIPAT